MSLKSLRLICDETLEIVKITQELYEAAIELFRNYFMPYENVSISCDLLASDETIKEITILVNTILRDNISFAVRDVNTNELVAICINKMVNPSANLGLDEVFASFQTPNMKTVGEYLHTIECTYDIFKEWKIDCVIELTFLTTRTDYSRRGIAVALTNHLLEYATKLKDDNCKESQELPQHLRGQKPKAIIAAFTSRYSQIVGEKLNFETLLKVENTKFSFEGKTFAEKIDPIHKYSTFAAKRL